MLVNCVINLIPFSHTRIELLNSVFQTILFWLQIYPTIFVWKVEQTTLMLSLWMRYFSHIEREEPSKTFTCSHKNTFHDCLFVWILLANTSAESVYCCQLHYQLLLWRKKCVLIADLWSMVLTNDKHWSPMTKTLAFQYQFAMYLFVIKAVVGTRELNFLLRATFCLQTCCCACVGCVSVCYKCIVVYNWREWRAQGK